MLDRHQYVEKLKAKLDEWDHELDTVETQVKDASNEAKQRSQLALAELKAARQQLGNSLDELVDATDEAWQKVRFSFDMAWDSVKSGLLAARAELMPRETEPVVPQK